MYCHLFPGDSLSLKFGDRWRKQETKCLLPTPFCLLMSPLSLLSPFCLLLSPNCLLIVSSVSFLYFCLHYLSPVIIPLSQISPKIFHYVSVTCQETGMGLFAKCPRYSPSLHLHLHLPPTSDVCTRKTTTMEHLKALLLTSSGAPTVSPLPIEPSCRLCATLSSVS